MSDLNILVISHYFPPSPGVGGRRWAKFVKYLSRKENVNVHVISAKNTIKDVQSSFEAELKNERFEHHILPSNYPKYLESLEFKKQTLFRKVMFRIQLVGLKKKIEGNYWDFSVFWKKHFEKTIPDIIRKNKIQKVIVSGPPFRYVFYAVELKNEFPDLEIIMDYRDPWNNLNEPYQISAERFKFEREVEKTTLKKIDKIISVSEFQKKLILENEPSAGPIYVVPNGFDVEDNSVEIKPKVESDKIKLTHFGTLHQLKSYYWKPFFDAYARIKKDVPELYKKLEIHLVGYTPEQVSDYIKVLELDVEIHGVLEPMDAYGELNQTDVALWFKYDGSSGDFATKFGDYISIRKFMWTFSVKGEVTDYIEAHKIGKTFYRDNDKMEDAIYQSMLNLENKETRTFNPQYDSRRLQISNLTEELIEVLNK